jgi:signal transduction histidine kinase
VETKRPLSTTDRALVEVFSSRLSVAFDNVILYEQLNDATVRLEERVRERTRALTAANHRLTSQWIRLRRANEFKSEVLGTIAHDLKNPLAVILGRAEMMNELAEMNPAPMNKIQEQLGHIRSSATQLTGMINDLVTDAMMDALDISIRQETVDISAILADVVTANRALAERKRQTVTLAAPPVRWAVCDPDRLREAVDNLLSNAIKYSHAGGKIELVMSGDEDSTTIIVKDEGAGLSQEDLGRLFGRFQRLSAKPTAGESSTGLGLSIVKRIVELHGGTIAADSPGPGRGATFTICLPMVNDPPS